MAPGCTARMDFLPSELTVQQGTQDTELDTVGIRSQRRGEGGRGEGPHHARHTCILADEAG